ncbi:MAG: hypothetical protein R3A52_26460 [Polyangiales bacterium]
MLEERAGDPAAAETAFALVEGPVPEAYAGLARVHAAADALVNRAEAALDALQRAAPEARAGALEQLLSALSSTPGALRDARLTARALGPLALNDDRVANLWLRAARRSDDPHQLPAVLRRLATRCALVAVRTRAALEAAERIDVASPAEAAELLSMLLDEHPGESLAAAALAAIAEHTDDPSLARDALRALARSAVDPWERDLLARFTGTASGNFACFAASLADPTPSRERSLQLSRLHDLVGDAVTLFAQRTRSLLAQTGSLDEGLAVARRFAAYDPLSSEAAIAWMGAASLSGDAAQVAGAVEALAGSLAPPRDLAAVTRAALPRLRTLDDPGALARTVESATRAGALSDRALRSAVGEVVSTAPASVAARWIEGLLGATEPTEHPRWLPLLADAYREVRLAGAEFDALERLDLLRPSAERLPRMADLAISAGLEDRAAALKARAVESTHAPAARRALLFELAAMHAAASPPRTVDAVAALDRLASERPDADTQAAVARALVEIGQPEAAVQRLTRWAGERTGADAAARLKRAAVIATETLRDPSRALGLWRQYLRVAGWDEAVLESVEALAAERRAVELMRSLYDDLAADAAGPHGRHAVAYRRAVFLERAGETEAALEEQLALFERTRTLGASFTAVERLATAAGRWDALLQAVEGLARAAPTSESRESYLLRASEVARRHRRDDAASLGYEVQAWQSTRSAALWERVRERARGMRIAHTTASRAAFEALIDGELAAGNQTWDDTARRVHALQALEVAALDTDDIDRAMAAAALYLRQHDAPATGRATVLALLDRKAVSPAMRDAVLRSPALVRASEPPAEPALTPPPPPRPTPLPSPAISPMRGSTLELISSPPSSVSARPVVRERRVTMPSSQPVPAALRRSGNAPPSPPPEPPETATTRMSPRPAPPPPVVPPSPPPPPLSPASVPPPPPLTPPPPAPVAASSPPVTPPPLPSSPPATPPPLPSAPPAPPRSALPPAPSDPADLALTELVAQARPPVTAAMDDGASDEDRRDAWRRALHDDPSRLDALAALVDAPPEPGREGEHTALSQLLAALRGEPVAGLAPPVAARSDPPDGVARVLFPPRWGRFPELGALLWEALGPAWRRDAQRLAASETHRPVSAASPLVPAFQSALRLLQLPRTTGCLSREQVAEGAVVFVGSVPPSVLFDPSVTRHPEGFLFRLGEVLEATRPAFLPLWALPDDDFDALCRALPLAFGDAAHGASIEPSVARWAGRLVDTIAPRIQRPLRDLVMELGPRLTPGAWRSAVHQARVHAGLLVSGDVSAALESVMRAAPEAVPRDPSRALAVYEPLRELVRFAASDEYLLLRW